MAEYYAVERSSEYLAHYGVKGMRWGVRKAVERGDAKRLAKHYKKANKKLLKLQRKADVVNNLRMRGDSATSILGSTVPLAGGIGLPIMAKATGHKLNGGELALAGFNGLAGASLLGLGLHDAIFGSKRSTAKGHTKAVKKAKNWQSEMKKAFKGSVYEKDVNEKPSFNDKYALYEFGTLGKDDKGRPIGYRAKVSQINGSNLVRDRNNKQKAKFVSSLYASPRTQSLSDTPVYRGIVSPSGYVHPLDEARKHIHYKKKRK